MASKKKRSKTTPAIKAEIAAMGAAYEAFRNLDDDAQRRSLRWLDERLSADRQARHSRDLDDDEVPF